MYSNFHPAIDGGAGKQPESDLQRTVGYGAVCVESRLRRTHLTSLYQEGAAKVRIPRPFSDTHTEAILLNTAGGLTDGDSLDWSFSVGSDASLVVTTQSCEKIYRSRGAPANVRVTANVAERGRFFWLPQETIFFDDAILHRRMDVSLATDAEATILEASIFGRRAMGETVKQGEFHDRWRITRNGRPIHAEDTRLTGEIDVLLNQQAVALGSFATASILHVCTQACDRLHNVRRLISDAKLVCGSASHWRVESQDKMLIRLISKSGAALRKLLVDIAAALLGSRSFPRVFTI